MKTAPTAIIKPNAINIILRLICVLFQHCKINPQKLRLYQEREEKYKENVKFKLFQLNS